MNNCSEESLEATFTVRYHELDSHGRAKVVTLLNYLQDVAGMHARKLGVSVTDLRDQGLTWVLSRIHLRVERYPRREEHLSIRTWPSTRRGIFSCREFELLEPDGAVAGLATTSWAVLNVATRRPVRLDDHLPDYPLCSRRALEDDFPSLPTPPAHPAKDQLAFRVLRADLDINRHVNNTVYAGWALETVPDRIAAGSLAELEVLFKAEALYGQTVLSRCWVLEESAGAARCLHQIVNAENGRELARLVTGWTGIPPTGV